MTYDVQDEDKDELTNRSEHGCQSTGALLVIAVVQDLTHSNAKHNHSNHGDNHTGQLASMCRFKSKKIERQAIFILITNVGPT
jgi:hypothetical protein